MKISNMVLCATIGVTFPTLVFAQSGEQQSRPDPTDAKAPVPPLHYESALDTYRPMNDQPTPAKVWKSANDLVRDSGSRSGMKMGDESGAMKNMKGMDMDAQHNKEMP